MLTCSKRVTLPRSALGTTTQSLQCARPSSVPIKQSRGRYRVVPVVSSTPEDGKQDLAPEKEEDVAALAAEFKATRDKEKVCFGHELCSLLVARCSQKLGRDTGPSISIIDASNS